MSFEKRFKKHARRSSPPRARRGGTPSGRRKLQFEQLEPRLLLNAHPLALVMAAARDLSVQIVDDHGTPTIQIVDEHALNPASSVLASQALADTSSVLIQGSDQNDTLRIDASVVAMGLPIDFIGGSGADTLVGPRVDSTWNVTGANAGTLGSVTFSGVENLTGASGNKDTFVFKPGGGLGGIVDGGPGGFDTIVLDGGTYSRVVYRGTGPNSGTIQRDTDLISYAGVEPISDNGSATTRVIVVDSGSHNDQILISDNAGKLNIASGNGLFESIDIAVAPSTSLEIQSGGGNDLFDFQSAPAAFNTILKFTGGGGTDTVQVSQDADITLTNTSLSFGSVSIALSGINRGHLTNSGATGHTIDASGFTGNVTLTGNTGDDILIGGDGNDVLTGGTGTNTLTGGAGNDRYVFGDGIETDTVNESNSGGTDTLDFTAVTSDLKVTSDKTTFSTIKSSLTQSGPELAEEIDVTLLPGVKAELIQSLNDLSSLIDKAQSGASAFSELVNALPFLGALTGGAVPNLAGLLHLTQSFQDLKAAVTSAINSLGATPKLSDVVDALNGITLPALFTTGGNFLTFSTSYRKKDSGPNPDDLEALIDIDFHGSRTEQVDLETGAKTKGAGIDIHAKVDLTATLTGRWSLGFETSGGSPSAFLVPGGTLTLDVDASATIASAPLNLGILALTISSGSVSFDSHADLTLLDLNGNGRITPSDVSGQPLSSIVSLTTGITTPFSASLTVAVDPGVKSSGIDLSTKIVTASVSLTNGIFGDSTGPSLPDISFSAPGVTLEDFSHVSTSDLIGMLNQVLNAMSGIGKGAALKTEIPFTGKTIGDVVDMASGFKTSVLDPLFKSGNILEPDFNGDGAVDLNDLSFSSVQSLAKALTAELGLGSLLDVNYDAGASEVTFALDYDQAVGDASVTEKQTGSNSQDEIQTLTINAVASGGLLTDTFRLGFPKTDGTLEFTSTIALGAADSVVESALAGLTSIDANDVNVTKNLDGTYDIEFVNGTHASRLFHKNVEMLVVDAKQLARGLSLNFGANLGDIASVKTEGQIILTAGFSAGFTFGIDLGHPNSLIEVTPPLFVPDNVAQVVVQTTTQGTANLNEVQQIHVNNATGLHGGPSTYTLWFDANSNHAVDGGEVTGAIKFDAPASGADSVENALRALPALNPTNVSVGGGSLVGNDRTYTVTFQNGKAKLDVAQIVGDATNLQGVSKNGILSAAASFDVKLYYNPAIGVVTTQQGDGSHNEQQTVTLLNASGGTFTLTFNGQTTGDLASAATGAQVATALNGLTSINTGGGSVSVTRTGNTFAITFDGGPLVHTNVAQITADAKKLVNTTAALTLSSVPVTAQTSNIRFDIDPDNPDAGTSLQADVQAAIDTALINAGKSLGFFKASLTKDSLFTAGHTPMSTPLLTDLAFTLNPAQVTVATTQQGDGSHNEIQTVAVRHATAGTFTLSFGGNTTTDIAFNATAGAVKTALEGLASIGAGNVGVSLSGTTYTVTFQGALANANQTQITTDDSKLTAKVSGSVRTTAVTNAASLPVAVAKAITNALKQAGINDISIPDVDAGLDGGGHITLTVRGGDLGVQFRSPLTVDAGGGRIAISGTPVTVSVDPLAPAVNVDARTQVTAAFNNTAYQEMGLLTAPTRFDGTTSNAINFTLVVNGTNVPVTLSAASRSSINDLVSDLQSAVNTALTGAGIANHSGDTLSDGTPNPTIRVFLVDPLGNRIGFHGRQNNPDAVASLAMNVPDSSTNGAITELGYVAGNGETHSAKAQGFFLENTHLTGDFALAASGVKATASLGFLGIQATGGGTLGSNKFIDVHADLSLKNPTGVGDADRVTVDQIVGALQNGNFFFNDSDKGLDSKGNPTTGVVDATLGGGVGLHLDVEPSTPLGGVSALDASLDLTATSPNWLTSAPSFSDPLGFGTDTHSLSSTPFALANVVPTNGRLTDSVTFVVTDGTNNGIVFLPAKDTAGFASRTDLSNALQTAVNAAMSAGSVSGTVTVAVNGDGKITLAGTGATLSARGPIAFSGPDVASILDKFRDLSFDDILAGLKVIIDFLRSLDGSGPPGSAIAEALDFKLPLIDKSVADLVDIASSFADKFNAIKNNPADGIQELNKFIDGLLGLSSDTLTYDAAHQVLNIDFDVTKSANLSRPFDLDLADAGLPAAFTNLVSLSASGSLDLGASVEFNLHLGLDLGGSTKSFFIRTGPSGTGLHASLNASGNALTFNAQIGPFGLSVIGGSAALNGTLDVTMNDDGDGRFDLITLTGLTPSFNLPSISDIDVDFPTDSGKNHAHVNMPLFLGSVSSPIPLDFASSLHGGLEHGQHNALVVDLNLKALVTGVGSPFTFTLPEFDFAGLANNLPGIFALLSDPSVTIDGLDRLLQTIQGALNGEIMGVKLPLIGNVLEGNPAANFIGDLRSDVLQPLAKTIRENNLNLDGLIGFIQQTLFHVFNDTLHILKDGDDQGTDISKNDIQFKFFDAAGNPTSVELLAHSVQLEMDLGKTFEIDSPPIDLDLGIPAFGIQAQLQPRIKMAFDLKLGFGVDDQKGFYFVTSHDPELSVTLYADLGGADTSSKSFDSADRAHLDARLLFLALKVADGVDLNGDNTISRGADSDADGIPDDANHNGKLDEDEFTHIYFNGSVNLADPNSDGKLTIGEMVSGSFGDIIKPTLSGEASLHAQARVDFSTLGADIGNILPAITADLLVDFGLSASPSSGFHIAPPQVLLANVTLDLGSFISTFAGPILNQIHDILAPFDWLIGPDGFLNKRIPLLSDLAGHTITGKDLILLFDPDDGPTIVAVLDFVQKLDYLSGLVSDAASQGANVGLNFGDLMLFDSPDVGNFGSTFTDHLLTLPGAGGISDIRDLGNFKNVSLPSVNDLNAALTTEGAPGSATSSFTSGVSEPGSIDFPILKPENIFKLILGQPDVTLVTVQMPKMQFNFLYRQQFPIIGPLVGTFAGGVGGSIDIGFGYDTRGLAEFVATKNPIDLLDGFFINDLDPKTGADKPEATLTAQISVGAAISLGIASAGVEGGIQATILFNFDDLDHDGKIRINELAALLEANDLNPLAVFDVSGKIDLFMRAFVEFLFFTAEFEFARLTLFKFEIIPNRPPLLGTMNGDVLTLNLGPNASGRANGDTSDGAEHLKLKMDGDDVVVDLADPFTVGGSDQHAVQVKGFGRFSGVHKIIVDGGAGDDTIDLSGLSSSIEVTAHGGAGNDHIIGGDGNDTIFGDEGDDTLEGGKGNDTISGGDGDDIIMGGKGNDTLMGDAGVDTITGGDDDDTLSGGAGDDSLAGGSGQNIYSAADFGSSETIDASGGDDTLDFSGKPQALTFFLLDDGGLKIEVGMTQTVTHAPATDPLDSTGPQVPADPVLGDFDSQLTVINVDGIKTIKGSDAADTFFVHKTTSASQIRLRGGKGSDRYVFIVGSAHIDANVDESIVALDTDPDFTSNPNPWDSGDTIEVRGTSGADTITVTDAGIDLAAGEGVQYASPEADANVLQIKVFGKNGDDTLNVESTSETVPVRVEGGGGDDLFTVGASAGHSGSVNDIVSLSRAGLNSPFGMGPLVLAGGAGQDSLVVDDSADASGLHTEGNLTAFSETRLGFTDPIEVGVVSGLGMIMHGGVGIEPVTEGDGSHNEVQKVHVDDPISGHYTLSFNGETTANINIDESAASVQSKLEALSTIGSGNVAVTRERTGQHWVYTVTFQNAKGNQNVESLLPDATSLLTAGRVEFEGFETSDVRMSKAGDVFTLGGSAVIADLPQNRQPKIIHAIVDTTTQGDGSHNEVQQIRILKVDPQPPTPPLAAVPPPTGSFTITFGSQTTGLIPFRASAADVQNALTALGLIGLDAEEHPNVMVSKSTSGDDDVYTLTFQNDLGETNVDPVLAFVANANTITGMTIVEGAGDDDEINVIATNTLNRATLNTSLSLLSTGTTQDGPSVTVETTTPGDGVHHEVKKLHVKNATGGTFTLSNDDITGDIVYNASAAVVQAALETLPGLSGNVSVSLQVLGADRVYTVTYTGDTVPHMLTPDPTKITGPSEVQTLTTSDSARGVGYFTISYRFEETAPILFGATAQEVQDALTALPLIGFDASNDPNVGVTEAAGVYTLTFQFGLQSQDIAQLTAAVAPLTILGDLGGLSITPITTTQGDADLSIDEIQQITVKHPAGLTGKFTLTFTNGDDTDTTSGVDFGASALDVQNALNGLTTIGGAGGSVAVVKAVVDGNDVYTVTFGGTLAALDVNQITAKIEKDGTDTLNVQSIRETTFFLGGGGTDIVNLNVDVFSQTDPKTPITTSGVNALITVDGQGGGDTYNVNLIGGNTASLINVFDSGLANDGLDEIIITGTDNPDLFLLRAAAAQTGLAFVALLNQDGTLDADHQPIERVNYDINLESITVNSRGADDEFYIDDTRANITINAGDGNDFFQIGQLYQTRRTPDEAAVAEGDVFATIETTKGWLSNGVSYPITINGDAGEDLFIVFHNLAVADLNGGADDDTFIIQAFALAGSTEDHRALTDLSGDAGADFIQYAVNAPVNINGGDGFDTVIIIGTEFGDDFVVTPHGVFGAGLHVDFVNIELLQVDGAEGDDRFFVLGTSPDIVTEISGGLGTDLFSVNGPTPANGVISNDLKGHSGILTHDVISADLSYNGLKVIGISANVADNDEPAVIITQTGGGSMVVKGDLGGLTLQQALDRHLVDSYNITLSRPPVNGSAVHIAIDPPPGLVFVDKFLNPLLKGDGSPDSPPISFSGSDWYKAHTVYFKVDDNPDIVDIPDVADLTHKVTAEIGGKTRAEITSALGSAGAGADNGSPVVIATTTPGSVSQNEVQTVTVAHVAGFGYFTLTFRDEETDPIPFGAAANVVERSLLDLPLIGNDPLGQPNVQVTGGPGTYTVTFKNGLGHQDVKQLKGRELAHLTDLALPSRIMPGGSDGLPEGLRGAFLSIVGSASHPEIVGQTRLILFADNGTKTLLVNKPWILPKGFGHLPNDTQYEIKLYTGLSVPNVLVKIFTEQRPALVVSETEGSTSVSEISTSTNAAEIDAEFDHKQVDQIEVRLSAAPVADVSVTLDGHGQLEFFDGDDPSHPKITSPLVFTAAAGPHSWDTIRTIWVRGIDDLVVEGFHKADIGLSASGTAAYANVKTTLTADVADNDYPGVRVMESDGSTDVVEFVSGPSPSNIFGSFGITQAGANTFHFPFNDAYQIELTQQPTSDVTIRVVSNPTRTSRTGGIRSFVEQLEVSTDGGLSWSLNPTLTFSHLSGLANSWNVPQTILVRALNDTRVDGSDTQVFAPTLDQLNNIQGPLMITGAEGPDHTGLLEREPIMLPGEKNEKQSMGNVVADGIAAPQEAAGDQPATIVIDPSDITQDEIDLINEQTNASVHLPDAPLTSPSQLKNVSLQVTHGPGKNKVRVITGGTAIDAHHWVLTLNHTWNSPFPEPGNADVPDGTSKYVLMQTNPNLLVVEPDQTDILQLHDTDNVNNYDDPNAPAPPFGSVDRNPFAAGRLFFDSQNLFGAKATVSTKVNGGPKVDGPTVSEVQELVLTATAGTFTLIFKGQTTSALSFNPTAAEIQSALEALAAIGAGNVAVTKDSEAPKYTITFQGALANSDQPKLHADSANLVGGLPLNRFRVTGLGMGGDGDSFQRTIGTGTDARSEPGGITFEQFEDLEIDLGPGNDHFTIDDTQAGVKTVLNTGAGQDRVDVKAISGHTFVNLGAGDDVINIHDDGHTLEPFQGLLTVSGDVPRADVVTLAKGSPAGTLANAVNEIQQLTIDATSGTFTLSITDPGTHVTQTTAGLAFDIAPSGLNSLQAALEGLSLIGAGNVSVEGAGSVYRITFINGKAGQDIPLLSANAAGLSNGLGAHDVMNVDDSGHTGPTVSVLTSSSLTGLSTTQVNEIQSLVVDATQGTFTVSFNGQTSGPLPWNVSASDLKTALQTLPGTPIKVGDVAVTKNDDVYVIRFQGNLSSIDVAQIVAASIDLKKQVEQSAGSPDAVPSAATAVAGDPQLVNGSVTVTTRVQGEAQIPIRYSTEPDHLTANTINDVQVVTVNATGGTYTLTLLSGTSQQFTTNPIPFDASAEFVRQTIQDAAAAAIAPGDTFEPQKFDVTVEKYVVDPNGEHQTVYIIGFQGKLRQFDSGPGVDLLKITNNLLTGGGATVATRMDGINYYGFETLNIDLGSNNDMFNIQGTTAGSRGFYLGGTLHGTFYAPGMAVTNVLMHDGNEQAFVSSNADLDFDSASGFDFLTGTLNDVNGALNLDFGSGRHKLMISDEGTPVGDGPGGDGTPVVITDTVANVPGGAAGRGLPTGPTDAEIWITGLAGLPGSYPEGGISYKADTATGNFFDGIVYWTGSGNDTITIDGTVNRSGSGQRTMTLLNTGLGNDNVTVSLNGALNQPSGDTGQDGFFALHTMGGAFSPAPGTGAVSDNDTVNASASTLPLVVFGGLGNDNIRGGSNNDIIFGDDGRVQYADPLDSNTLLAVVGFGGRGDLISSQVLFPTWALSRDLTLGGPDTITGNAGEDILVGGAAGDQIDGSPDDDLIFGDAAKLSRRPTDITNLRFKTLTGTTIYAQPATNAAGADNTDALARNYRDPNGTYAPSWALWRIHNLYHSADIQNGVAGSLGGNLDGLGRNMLTGAGSIVNSFGGDYIAGGGGSDEIFGQLGNDTIQGDGSIDIALTGGVQVGASRDVNNALVLRPSFESATDGDDYIEGGGGNDTVFGGLGQDDIIGGSSDLFTLTTPGMRPDGSDMIFGGAGTHTGRYDYGDLSLDGVGVLANQLHARDADTILGDNGDIFRLVGINSPAPGGAATGFLAFNYDQNTTSQPFEDRGTLRIIPRATRLLDYTPGGPDFTPATEAGPADVAINPTTGVRDIGGADEIHGEGGDDFIYGTLGNDVLFGDAQNDVMIGGYGADWMSGGTGDDGMLGDDGRILVSRNSTSVGEPLYGMVAVPAVIANKLYTAGNGILVDVLFVTPTAFLSGLKYTVDLTPQNLQPSAPNPPDPLFRPLYANDIMYGGGGNDSMHGGAGDDAFSGAEALAGTSAANKAYTNSYDNTGTRLASHLESDFAHPYNPGNALGYQTGGLNATKFDLYDATDPLRPILLTAGGNLSKTGIGDNWILNFDQTEGLTDAYWIQGQSTYPGVKSDGDDHIFGDLGNDWLVGGTGRDVMFSGWGDDLINLDDVLSNEGSVRKGSLNPGTDTNPSYEDLGFGGAGRDVLLVNTNGDRALDWNGEFNSFFAPFAQYGADSISRLLQPAEPEFLQALSKSDGADQTLTAQYGSDPTRNGEPFGELGLVLSQDAAWGDQKGQSRDPQPGNIGGSPVDLHNGTSTAGVKPIYETARGAAPRDANSAAVLTDAQLAPIVAEAKALWTRALGASDSRLSALDSVQVVVGSLPDGRLGVTLGGHILLDYNAAGYGWFTDGSLGARVDAGRMDLLTVVAHELGNAMGFAEDTHATSAVTTPLLKTGARYLPDGSIVQMAGLDGSGASSLSRPGLEGGFRLDVRTPVSTSGASSRLFVDWDRALSHGLTSGSDASEERKAHASTAATKSRASAAAPDPLQEVSVALHDATDWRIDIEPRT